MKNKDLSLRRIVSLNSKISRLKAELSRRNIDESLKIVLELKELLEDLNSIIEREY